MTASKERISALMDNEQQFDSSVRAALNDPEHRDTWERYHLIRDVLKNDLPDQFELDLSAKIAAAIEQEPTILAPKRNRVMQVIKHHPSRILHWVGQYGIAASVAVAVLIGVQHYQSNDMNPADMNHYSALNTVPVGGSATPVSINYSPEPVHLLQKKQSMTEAEVQAQRLRIARYIQDHQLQQRLSPQER